MKRRAPALRATIARILIATVLLLLAAAHADAARIPAFARKYKVSCVTCHSVFPLLNPTGEAFAGNGFEFVIGEAPVDTVGTGDPTLRLMSGFPLAVRLDAYVASLSKRGTGEVASDLQTPWVMKLLSGGQIADKVSYYVYFLLSERGEVGGVEDAYVQFSDVGGWGVDLLVGQFQVSDPLGKRETRLQYEDYQAYRVRVGDVRADLTYERGVLAAFSPWEGAGLTAMLVNGRGLDEANNNRQYDTDSPKNAAFYLSQDIGPLSIGGYGYFGKEGSEGAYNSTSIVGPSATLSPTANSKFTVQHLVRKDDDPFFGSCSASTPCPGGVQTNGSVTTNASLAEAVFWPDGQAGKWALSFLYNRISADRPVISLRLGEQDDGAGFLETYETGTANASYLLKRNVRLIGEGTYDFSTKGMRMIFGLSTAF